MIVSLRIMHFGFLISVMVAVLIIINSPDATAQIPEVECPCDFESVPMTTGCWTEQRQSEPVYTAQKGPPINPAQNCFILNIKDDPNVVTQLVVGDGQGIENALCSLRASGLSNCNNQSMFEKPITSEEVLACQCELLAYTTALNEVAGISVSGGPPYVCGNVDLRTCQGLPPLPEAIPTLNEYGMIITAGVLGLLAVIGLFVIRRRKVSA